MPDPRRLNLSWRDLPAELRAALMDKLAGLYEQDSDESAFDSLAVDKQQALFILTHRLRELSLWAAVERVENVYGEGGVGMNFAARPTLLEMLRRHPRFTRWLAAHRGTSGGFLERGRSRAALHFLYTEVEARRWGVHFDLYSPLTSPLSAWQHLWHEKVRGLRPDWRMIKESISS